METNELAFQNQYMFWQLLHTHRPFWTWAPVISNLAPPVLLSQQELCMAKYNFLFWNKSICTCGEANWLHFPASSLKKMNNTESVMHVTSRSWPLKFSVHILLFFRLLDCSCYINPHRDLAVKGCWQHYGTWNTSLRVCAWRWLKYCPSRQQRCCCFFYITIFSL